jgi:hypothetical protein
LQEVSGAATTAITVDQTAKDLFIDGNFTTAGTLFLQIILNGSTTASDYSQAQPGYYINASGRTTITSPNSTYLGYCYAGDQVRCHVHIPDYAAAGERRIITCFQHMTDKAEYYQTFAFTGPITSAHISIRDAWDSFSSEGNGTGWWRVRYGGG